MEGDRLHWTHFSATLAPDGRNLVGQGLYIAGPEQGSLTTPEMDVSLTYHGPDARLRLEYGNGRELTCEATFGPEHLEGTCRRDKEELLLRLVRVEPVEPEVLEAVKGVYRLGNQDRILIDQLGGVPILLELPSGQVRALFPKGDGEWTAGPRFLVGYPEEWHLAFRGDELTVRRRGQEPQVAWRRPDFVEEPLSFSSASDGTTLRGTLTLPAGPGPHPAMVWVHGSGQTARSEAMFFPRYLADLGFALLAFDKRGVGDSEGTYEMPDGSSFDLPFLRRRAADVASALNALRHHPRIAAEKVGLIGISQAGWVMPIAASAANAAFTISWSGGATRLSQEEYFSELTDELVSDASLPGLDEALEKTRALPPKGHDWSVEFAGQDSPGLWLYGLNDRINPSQLCIEVLEAVKAEHDKDFTIATFPMGNHPLMESRLGGKAETFVLSRFAEGVFPEIESWLAKKGLLPSQERQ